MEKEVINGKVKMEDGFIHFIDCNIRKIQCFMCNDIKVFNRINSEYDFRKEQGMFFANMEKECEKRNQFHLGYETAKMEYSKHKISFMAKFFNKIIYDN